MWNLLICTQPAWWTNYIINSFHSQSFESRSVVIIHPPLLQYSHYWEYDDNEDDEQSFRRSGLHTGLSRSGVRVSSSASKHLNDDIIFCSGSGCYLSMYDQGIHDTGVKPRVGLRIQKALFIYFSATEKGFVAFATIPLWSMRFKFLSNFLFYFYLTSYLCIY